MAHNNPFSDPQLTNRDTSLSSPAIGVHGFQNFDLTTLLSTSHTKWYNVHTGTTDTNGTKETSPVVLKIHSHSVFNTTGGTPTLIAVCTVSSTTVSGGSRIDWFIMEVNLSGTTPTLVRNYRPWKRTSTAPFPAHEKGQRFTASTPVKIDLGDSVDRFAVKFDGMRYNGKGYTSRVLVMDFGTDFGTTPTTFDDAKTKVASNLKQIFLVDEQELFRTITDSTNLTNAWGGSLYNLNLSRIRHYVDYGPSALVYNSTDKSLYLLMGRGQTKINKQNDFLSIKNESISADKGNLANTTARFSINGSLTSDSNGIEVTSDGTYKFGTQTTHLRHWLVKVDLTNYGSNTVDLTYRRLGDHANVFTTSINNGADGYKHPSSGWQSGNDSGRMPENMELGFLWPCLTWEESGANYPGSLEFSGKPNLRHAVWHWNGKIGIHDGTDRVFVTLSGQGMIPTSSPPTTTDRRDTPLSAISVGGLYVINRGLTQVIRRPRGLHPNSINNVWGINQITSAGAQGNGDSIDRRIDLFSIQTSGANTIVSVVESDGTFFKPFATNSRARTTSSGKAGYPIFPDSYVPDDANISTSGFHNVDGINVKYYNSEGTLFHVVPVGNLFAQHQYARVAAKPAYPAMGAVLSNEQLIVPILVDQVLSAADTTTATHTIVTEDAIIFAKITPKFDITGGLGVTTTGADLSASAKAHEIVGSVTGDSNVAYSFFADSNDDLLINNSKRYRLTTAVSGTLDEYFLTSPSTTVMKSTDPRGGPTGLNDSTAKVLLERSNIQVETKATGGTASTEKPAHGRYTRGAGAGSDRILFQRSDTTFSLVTSGSPPTISISPTAATVVEVTSAATFTASPSPGGSTLQWKQLSPATPEVVFSDKTAANPTITVPGVTASTVFTLICSAFEPTNSSVNSSSAALTVTNNAGLTFPGETLISAADTDPSGETTVNELSAILMTASGTNQSANRKVGYGWSQISGSPAGTFLAGDAVSSFYIAPAVSADTAITLQVDTYDGVNTSQATQALTIKKVFSPTVNLFTLTPSVVNSGVEVLCFASATDPNADNIQFVFFEFTPSGGHPRGTFLGMPDTAAGSSAGQFISTQTYTAPLQEPDSNHVLGVAAVDQTGIAVSASANLTLLGALSCNVALGDLPEVTEFSSNEALCADTFNSRLDQLRARDQQILDAMNCVDVKLPSSDQKAALDYDLNAREANPYLTASAVVTAPFSADTSFNAITAGPVQNTLGAALIAISYGSTGVSGNMVILADENSVPATEVASISGIAASVAGVLTIPLGYNQYMKMTSTLPEGVSAIKTVQRYQINPF